MSDEDIDDGCPAFPFPAVAGLPNGDVLYGANGMSLRDYFAAKAMAALLAKLPVVDQLGELGHPVLDKVQYNRDVADSAYILADAMLAERAKVKP